jgi:hypothetical protein
MYQPAGGAAVVNDALKAVTHILQSIVYKVKNLAA